MPKRRRKPDSDVFGPGDKTPGPDDKNKGGNKGGKKGDKNKGGDKKKNRKQAQEQLYQRAVRDVNLGLDPMMDELQRARDQASDDYHRSSGRVSEIYEALLGQLAPQTGAYNQAVGGYGEDLQSQIGGLAEMLGSGVPGVPQEEITAGTGVVGSIGAGGLSQLANDRARNAAYNTSAIRQGGIEQATTSRNYLQDFQNFTDDLAQRRLDIQSDTPQLIKQRLDELRDQRFQKQMSLKEFALRRAAAEAQGASSDALGQYLKGQIGGSSGGGGGGGGSGGGGGGGQGGDWQRPAPSSQPSNPSGALNKLLSGNARWKGLGDFQQASVRSMWDERVPQGRVTSEYERLFPSQQVHLGDPGDFVRMLKQISRKRSRLGQDPGGPGGGR